MTACLIVQAALSWMLMDHLRDQLNPDGAVYGRLAELWRRGDAHLALNATWGVLGPWSALPGLWLGMETPRALRAGQVVAALVATAGTHALLGCFGLTVLVRGALTLGGALYAASAATMYLTSDASYLAVFVWMCWALLTPRETILGLPRPAVAGALAGLSFLARPVGLPMGIALAAGAELARIAESGWTRGRRALGLTAFGWALVAGPWILVLSLHYGTLTTSHSPRIVHAAVGPHTDHPWNLPSFTRLHRPPDGRITTWEDPSTVVDPGLDWSPFESPEAWSHQVRLVRRNVEIILAELIGFDGLGVALASVVVLPLLAWWSPRPGVGWREPWLAFCVLLHLVALAPLHVERRYLWPLVPVSLAAVGSIVARLENTSWRDRAGRRGRRVLVAIGLLVALFPNMAVSATRVAALLGTPARREKAIVAQWATELRARRREGPVVSWTPHAWKALDPEGLYLAWALEQPWLANLATDGRDLAAATALGARVLVAKTAPGDREPPPWLGDAWTIVTATDVHGDTLRDGRYLVLVPRE